MMLAKAGTAKAQAAVDFMVSYGIVLLVLGIAVILLYSLAINNSYSETPYCTPSPGFACGAYSINSISGVLLIQLAQASGAEVTVGGVACAANVNASGNKPAEGNIYVTQASSYYPSGGFVTNTMYSGRSVTYQMYCYNNGGVAKGNLGNGFTGYVWMNYTIPGYGQQTQLVATINAKYT